MNLKSLSKDEPIEKTFLSVPRFALDLMGQYPSKATTPLRRLNSAFHFIIYFLGVVAEFAYGFYYLKVDVHKGVHAICPAISCAVSFIKMCLIAWHSEELCSVLSRLRLILFEEKKEDNKKLIREASAKGNFFAFMILALGLVTCVIYGLQPLLNNAYRVSRGLSYLWDETALMILVPTVMLRLPWYPITYSMSAYVGCVCSFAFTGADGIFISFCFHLAALLQIIQDDMKRGLRQFEDKYYMTKDEYRACNREFAKIVNRHNQLIDLIKDFSKLYTMIILVHFGTSAIVIGASIIEAMLYGGLRAFLYMTFTFAVTLELFVYCYGGNTILSNSNELGIAAYFTKWYTYDIKVQKMVLMLIIRSQMPLTMAVPFFKPSFETFSSIIRTAGSIVALVKSLLL